MKMKSGLAPVRSVRERELKFDDVDHLYQAVSKLGFTPLDPTKCEVIIPSVIVKKMATMVITLKDKNNDQVIDGCEEVDVCIKNAKGNETIQVKPIEEVGDGRYEASFTLNRCGYYMISIMVDGCHIPGSPHKYVRSYVAS